MEQRQPHPFGPLGSFCAAQAGGLAMTAAPASPRHSGGHRRGTLALLVGAPLAPDGAPLAQTPPAGGWASPSGGAAWRRCAALSSDNQARLACFDQWATDQQGWNAPAA